MSVVVSCTWLGPGRSGPRGAGIPFALAQLLQQAGLLLSQPLRVRQGRLLRGAQLAYLQQKRGRCSGHDGIRTETRIWSIMLSRLGNPIACAVIVYCFSPDVQATIEQQYAQNRGAVCPSMRRRAQQTGQLSSRLLWRRAEAHLGFQAGPLLSQVLL